VFEQLRQRRSSSSRLDATTLRRIFLGALPHSVYSADRFLSAAIAPGALMRVGSARFGGYLCVEVRY
jgi:hypothetical protein